jgi:hypothetical protein
MSLFGSLFGDPRGAARGFERSTEANISKSRAGVEDAANLLDERAQASAGEQRALAQAFQALSRQGGSLERQSAQRGAREQAQGAARQAGSAAGPSNAQRLQLGEMVAMSQTQALLAERSQRIQRQIAVHQAIGGQLAQAGQFSQAGAAGKLQAISQFESMALQARQAAAQFRAQSDSAPSPLGRMVSAAGSQAFSSLMGQFGGGSGMGQVSGAQAQGTAMYGQGSYSYDNFGGLISTI